MSKTPAQRGPFGRWLTRVRTERYSTQEDARRDMQRLAGLYIGESEYAQWEAGSRTPRPDNPKVLRLYEFFGSRPEDPVPPEPTASTEMAALLVAMTRALEAQADAFTALRLSLDQARAEAIGGREATTDELAVLRRELAAIRSLVESGAADGPPPPGVPVP